LGIKTASLLVVSRRDAEGDAWLCRWIVRAI